MQTTNREEHMNAKVAGIDEKMVFGGIDPKTAGTETLKLTKTFFETAYSNIIKVQDLNEKIVKDMIEVGKEMQTDALKMVDLYLGNAKKGRDQYKKAVEESFKRAEEVL